MRALCSPWPSPTTFIHATTRHHPMAAERPIARNPRPLHDSLAMRLYRSYDGIEEYGEDKFRSDLHTPSHAMGSSHTLSRLRLGSLNAVTSAQLRSARVTHVVNCLSTLEEVHEPDLCLHYLTLNLEDEEDQVLTFDPVCDFIHTALSSSDDAVVLVHCAMGVSRSASLVCAYIMRHERLTVTHALAAMRAIRAQVAPNAGFIQQLLDYEARIGLPAATDAARSSHRCSIM